jgi:hypothetical protein
VAVSNRTAATARRPLVTVNDDGHGEVLVQELSTRRTTVIRTVLQKQDVQTYAFAAKGSEAFTIGFDSQASFGITNDIRLFGGIPLKNDTTFIITDWANEERTCSQHGMTVFGPMIYSTLAQSTIICGKDFYTNWTTTNETEFLAMNAQHRTEDISLEFRADDTDKVLSCTVSTGKWDLLCGMATLPRGHTMSPAIKEVIAKHAISKVEYNQVLEAIRFHECTCHSSLTSMTNTLQRRVLNHCPLSARDVDNIRFVVPFGCTCCLCGKSTHRSTNPHKDKQEKKIEQRDELLDAKQVHTSETIGLDLMFEDGQVFLVSVGKVLGYAHLVPVTSKKKTAVAEAISAVIDDYRRNQVAVGSIYGDKIPPDGVKQKIDLNLLHVTEIEADNEGAFIAASVELLPSMGIHATFVASGEHVGYVERAIRTIRERTHSTMVGLRWSLDHKLKSWLMLNVVNWMNILSSTKSPDSAWSLLTRRVLNYRELTTTVFGELVVAHRTVASLAPGQAQGELGISLGPVLNNSSSIYFYSLSTKQVKIRRRYVRAEPVDLSVYGFTLNPNYVAPGAIGNSYIDFMRTRPAPAQNSGEEQEEHAVTHEPPAGSFMTDGGPAGESLSGAVEGIHDVIPPVVPEERRAAPESYDKAAHQRFLHELYSDGGPLQQARNEIRRDIDRDQVSLIENELLYHNKQLEEERKLIQEAVAAGAAEPVKETAAAADAVKPVPATPVARELFTDLFTPRVLPRRQARDRLYKGVKNQRARSVKRATMKVLMRSMQAKEGVESVVSFKTTNWKKALLSMPKEANDAISKEIEQIVNEYEVCTPSHDRPEEFHRSVDLFDRKSDGTYKARLCVSVTQHGGVIDYGIDLYSPTIDTKVIFMIFALGLQSGLELTAWDIKGAFLKSPMLTKGVYVRVDAHVADLMIAARPEWKEYLRRDGSLMLECNKAWYGLAASSALWNAEIHKTLVEDCGYTQHSMVACLYYRKVKGKLCFMMLHVDDIGAMMPPDRIERNRVKAILEGKYESMKEQTGDLIMYIGMEIRQVVNRTSIQVNMAERIRVMGKDFGIEVPTKLRANPAKTTPSFMSPPSENDEKFADVKRYRSLVMTMQYITIVRPHCKFHVSWLASRQASPTVLDWKKAVGLAEYLLSTVNDVVTIKPSGTNIVIRVYTDASFDVHADSKSHSGLCVYIGEAGCAVFASSNKQHCMTRSSTDAEIVAAETGVFMGNFYRDVLYELGVSAIVLQLQDNLSCISLVESGTRAYDKKERHMVRRINFMKEYMDDVANSSSLIWCPTTEMTADALTKDLHSDVFEKHKCALLGAAV